MAMETGPFLSDFPINTVIRRGFSIAMFDSQRVFPRFPIEVMEQGLQVQTCFLIASLGMNVGSSAPETARDLV